MSASVAERRPLREREELAAAAMASSAAKPKSSAEADAGSAAGSKASAEAEAAAPAAGTPKPSAGAQAEKVTLAPDGVAASETGRGEGAWPESSPKKRTVRSALPMQADISEEDRKSVADSPALSSAPADDNKFVWADKYRPSVLNEFICNKAVAAELRQLVIVITRSHSNFTVKTDSHSDRMKLQPLLISWITLAALKKMDHAC